MNKSTWKNLFSFEYMITPVVLQILMILWVIAVVVGGIASIVQSLKFWFDAWMFWSGLWMIFLAPIGIRIYAEILSVIFKINDKLQKLLDK